MASPLEELEDIMLYSGEDEENGDTSDTLVTPAGEGRPGEEDLVPVELKQTDWDDMQQQLDEFLGSDVESDSESAQSDDDDGKNSDDASADDMNTDGIDSDEPTPTDSARKRKLADVDPSDEDDSDTSTASKSGSKLQRRKKRALERVTSLTNVVNASKSPHKSESGLPSPETTGPEEEAQERANGTNGNNVGTEDGGGNGDDDDDGSDLEAEMMAAFEEEEEEDQEGETVAA